MKNDLRNKDNWAGVWTALITPLNSDLSLDKKSLKSLIKKQVDAGISGLVIAGSTGEGSLLDEQKYSQLLDAAVSIVSSEIPVVAGLGIGGTEETLKNARIAKLKKCDGVLASPSAYIKPTQKGLFEHYVSLSKEDIPICLYEVPSRSSVSISLDCMEALLGSNLESVKNNIKSIKDASNNLERAYEENKKFGDKIAILTGEDSSFPQFLANGGDGVVSVASHVYPKLFQNTLARHKETKLEEALNGFEKILPAIDMLFCESNPIPVKKFGA